MKKNPVNMTDQEHAEVLFKTMVNLNHYITELCNDLPEKLSKDIELTDKIREYLFSEEVFNNLNANQKMKLFQIMQGNLDWRVKLLFSAHASMPNNINQLGLIKQLKNDIAKPVLDNKKVDPEKVERLKKILLDEISKRMTRERQEKLGKVIN